MHELRLFLAKQTIFVTIFIAYLFVAVGIAIIRSLRLVYMHCSFSRFKPVSLENLINNEIDGSTLAKMALANRVTYGSLLDAPGPKTLLATTDEETIQKTISTPKN